MNTKLMTAMLITMLGVSVHAADAASLNANAMPVIADGHNNNDLSGRFGVGLVLGEPTGVSPEYFFNDTMAVDGVVGWSFHDETDFYLHSDLLWHKFDLVSVPRGQLPFYLGVGAWARFHDDDDNGVGIRVPFGMAYIFDNLSLDVFAEIAPTLEFTPSLRVGSPSGSAPGGGSDANEVRAGESAVRKMVADSGRNRVAKIGRSNL